jgi:hypothetical protein
LAVSGGFCQFLETVVDGKDAFVYYGKPSGNVTIGGKLNSIIFLDKFGEFRKDTINRIINHLGGDLSGK